MRGYRHTEFPTIIIFPEFELNPFSDLRALYKVQVATYTIIRLLAKDIFKYDVDTKIIKR